MLSRAAFRYLDAGGPCADEEGTKRDRAAVPASRRPADDHPAGVLAELECIRLPARPAARRGRAARVRFWHGVPDATAARAQRPGVVVLGHVGIRAGAAHVLTDPRGRDLSFELDRRLGEVPGGAPADDRGHGA